MIDDIFLETLNPYLVSLRKGDEYFIVETLLNSSWVIPEHIDIKKQVKESKTKGLYVTIFYSDESGFDLIIDWIKKEVVDVNIELEKKESLLKSKVDELKEIFESSPLVDLENMVFTTTQENPLKLGKKSEVKGSDVKVDPEKVIKSEPRMVKEGFSKTKEE